MIRRPPRSTRTDTPFPYAPPCRSAGAEPEHAPLHGLGSDRWAKAQSKAREKAHDVAAELLQIQARRAAKPGLTIEFDDADYANFIEGFPFTPTPDQQKAIDAEIGRASCRERVCQYV